MTEPDETFQIDDKETVKVLTLRVVEIATRLPVNALWTDPLMDSRSIELYGGELNLEFEEGETVVDVQVASDPGSKRHTPLEQGEGYLKSKICVAQVTLMKTREVPLSEVEEQRETQAARAAAAIESQATGGEGGASSPNGASSKDSSKSDAGEHAGSGEGNA